MSVLFGAIFVLCALLVVWALFILFLKGIYLLFILEACITAILVVYVLAVNRSVLCLFGCLRGFVTFVMSVFLF
jgi:hypothetical protein